MLKQFLRGAKRLGAAPLHNLMATVLSDFNIELPEEFLQSLRIATSRLHFPSILYFMLFLHRKSYSPDIPRRPFHFIRLSQSQPLAFHRRCPHRNSHSYRTLLCPPRTCGRNGATGFRGWSCAVLYQSRNHIYRVEFQWTKLDPSWCRA